MLVDAAPVRAHVLWLQASGIGIQRLIDIAPVGEGVLNGLMYKPSKYIQDANARALLAVQPGMDSLAPGARIPGVGTRRRLQALAAIGWPSSVIAERVDRTRGHIAAIRSAEMVTVRVAKEIAQLYQRMYYVRPQPATTDERIAVTHTLRWSARMLWVPPVAWTEATIDDPTARPSIAEASLLRDGLTVRTEVGSVDMVAVLRRATGEDVEIHEWERDAAVLALYRRQWPTYRISQVTGVNPASVNDLLALYCPTFTPDEAVVLPDRYRRRQAERVFLDGRWVHPEAPHGEKSGYVHWACRCVPCTVANRRPAKELVAA